MELLGRRVDDDTVEEIWAAGPGAYRKTTILPKEGGDPVVCWHVMCPGGATEKKCENGMLLGPKPPASGHFVKENEDGTITCELSPPEDPENSNSTLCPACGWHGQIKNGVWMEI